MQELTNICIIGTGNVAISIAYLFLNHQKCKLTFVGRNKNKTQLLSSFFKCNCSNNLDNLPWADYYILCISDDSIAPFLSAVNIPNKNATFAHTSGMTSITVFPNSIRHFGVFYPFQTFTANLHLNNQGKPELIHNITDLDILPICIEGNNATSISSLKKLALFITQSVYQINSEQRYYIHLAGVFANNFCTHCINIAKEQLTNHCLPEELLYPILKTTLKKAIQQNTQNILTGPAKRGDLNTINKHIEILHPYPQEQQLYIDFTKSILATYHPNLTISNDKY